ncbi:Mediator of RNA polymerase II transcription subunit 10 [Aphelenchoides besseyi]|nr:Mediator of RNA polymerase II transcription subunit 10 [Aphelenchoides besseyi]
MSEQRYMPSIFPECDKLKQVIREPKLAEERPYDIDLDELRREVLNQSAPGSDNLDQRFQALESTLEQFQENARHIGVIVSDFSPKSQDVLNQKIHTMISGLQELNQIKNRYSDVKIPLEVLKALDEGKNPQLYTATCLERTLQKNKEVNGKTELYKKLHASLLRELGEEMSEDAVAYLKIRRRKEFDSDSPAQPR